MQTDGPMRRLFRILYPLGIYILISNAVILAFFSLGLKGAATTAEALKQYQLEILFISGVITLPVLVIFIKRDHICDSFQNPPLWGYFVLVLIGVSSCIGLNGLIRIGTDLFRAPGYEEITEGFYHSRILMEILTIGILVPVVEELVFRGLIYRRMRTFTGAGQACFFSALLFAIYHGNLVQGLYAFLMGFLFAVMYECFRRIAAPVILHVAANLVSVLASEYHIFDTVSARMGPFILLTAGTLILTFILLFVIKDKLKMKEVDL